MRQYLELMQQILDDGINKDDRTGTGTLSLFGVQMRFNLAEGFPLLTTKKLHLRSIIHELLWFLRGETNISYLHDQGVTIWDQWATTDGELGPIYGKQWRSWQTPSGEYCDQITTLIEQIKTTPHSRRLLVSAWNVGDLPDESLSPQDNVRQGKMALAPCHALFQFYVANGRLSCQLYQRSADIFLGVPFNLASYALLTQMIAHQCDLDLGDFIWTGGDVHLYRNHLAQAKLQLERKPRQLPRLILKTKPASIFTYQFDDFELTDYDPHPHIKAPIAV